jgi:HPt (histidine-containing phosphotransfer) domain-containing protein
MIDWSRVRELKDEVGADAFEEVVELFLEEVEEVILRLQGGERSQLEQDLHFLKGSALNLGFQNFSDLCLNGERLSSEGQASRVDVAKILQSYAASKTVFLSEMAEKG